MLQYLQNAARPQPSEESGAEGGWRGGTKKDVGTHVNVISFILIRNIWPSLSQFSKNSQMLGSITFTYLVTNFTQIKNGCGKHRCIISYNLQ